MKYTNPTTCPKCAYIRKDTDNAPLSECPNCGIYYEKYVAMVAARTTSNTAPANEPSDYTSTVPDTLSINTGIKSSRKKWLLKSMPIFVVTAVILVIAITELGGQLNRKSKAIELAQPELAQPIASAHAEVMWTVEGGKITGARNVLVFGKSYDVVFGDKPQPLPHFMNSDFASSAMIELGMAFRKLDKPYYSRIAACADDMHCNIISFYHVIQTAEDRLRNSGVSLALSKFHSVGINLDDHLKSRELAGYLQDSKLDTGAWWTRSP